MLLEGKIIYSIQSNTDKMNYKTNDPWVEMTQQSSVLVTCVMKYNISIKAGTQTRQSLALAAHTGLYLPSIKCPWEKEGAGGPSKTEPNNHNRIENQDT